MLDKVRLDEITTFPKLLDYLRDELDWPIEEESFDDLTFDYTPADFELKLDGEKGRIEIKQLRPLVSTQPWGIFFLNFPGKDMPVTVLRRILGKLARKKRASQNPAERAVWDKHDLLFIASFGKTGERQLSFAHFQDRSDVGDLPALRVLGWDGQNTIRRLSYTNDILKSRLRWPDDPRDLESWRGKWSGAFTEGKGESVTTSKAMAQELARLARQIRSRANELLEAETEQGPLRQLHAAFKEALIHDLKPDDFADMYAQTIAYGLLSARIARASGALTADDAALMAPATNPFLQELLTNFLQAGGRKGGMDFDELGVNEVVEMLRDANMEAVLRDFDDRNPQEDPVIHFYELFLKEYDAKKRMQRGVFYTPRPVVSFIVRSVDEVLRTEFGLEDGLADTATWGEVAARQPEIRIPEGVQASDPFVRILDPATGTGTFLVDVIGLVHERMVEKWRKSGKTAAEIDDLWNGYVPQHLLPRLYGFELMMAPYAIAHMKLGVKLADTGYHFRSKERARIYLTNALEEPHDFDMQLAFMSEALAHEAKAANVAKRDCFTVVLGNPPYSGVSSNNFPDAIKLVDAYKTVGGEPLGEKKLWLQDDYVKFFRLFQQKIEDATLGIIGVITNNGFLDNPTFRGMRYSLLGTFQDINVINLRGSAKKKDTTSDGLPDENVFEIQQGVSISIFSRSMKKRIVYSDVTGTRNDKYALMTSKIGSSLTKTSLFPNHPFYFFTPVDEKNRAESEKFPLISHIMPVNSVGVVTARDSLTIAMGPAEIFARVSRFAALPEEEARREFGLRQDVRDWKVSLAQQDLRSKPLSENNIIPILYRPFDVRYTYYTGRTKGFIGQPAAAIMRNMIQGGNIGIMTTRKIEVGTFGHCLCVNMVPESHAVSLKEVNYLFPLWIKPQGTEGRILPNFKPSFIERMMTLTGLAWDDSFESFEDETETGHLAQLEAPKHLISEGQLGPRDLFSWIYGVLHSPEYRRRYADLFRSDYARVPLPKDAEIFRAVAVLGARLVGLHLTNENLAPELREPAGVRLAGIGAAEIPSAGGKNGYPRFVNGRVYINPDRWFEEVPEATWAFYVGGYQVCEKWLKDRRGRALSADDILHYRRIVHALTETRKTMAEIDTVIEAHGGWPDAFRGMAD